MKEHQYVEDSVRLTAGDVVRLKKGGRKLVAAAPTDTLLGALAKMRKLDISQLPVVEKGRLTGVIFEDTVMSRLLKGDDLKSAIVREVMGAALPEVTPAERIDTVMQKISGGSPAVIVAAAKGRWDIITKYDVLQAVSRIADA
jgi:cystathionine beta-synthase